MNRNFTVGLFVLAALVLFTGGLFMIGNRHDAFSKHFFVYTSFKSLAGLAKGSTVQVGGMNAGQVEAIRIPDSPSAKFRVKAQLNEKFHGLVRTDSVATIATEGVVGDTFLSILPGSAHAPAISEGGMLASQEPVELADLLNQTKGTISDVDTAVKNANGLLLSVGGNLNGTITAAHTVLHDVDAVTNGIKRGQGTVGMLLRNPKVAKSVRQTIRNAQQTTRNLETASAKANTLLADIRSKRIPEKVNDTLVSLRDASAKLDDASTRVQRTVAQLTAPDAYGNSAGTNLRESISSMNTAAGNMADDSEALKHNFLLRGFFKRRGYYSLMGIPPARYRRDSTFTSTHASRSWLRADLLFTQTSSGQVELTPEGKFLIDRTVSRYGDSLQGMPIMVEGYDSLGSMANDINSSFARALVVRSYILDRFHLAAVQLGAIGLGDMPPRRSGRSSWNGICIVALQSIP